MAGPQPMGTSLGACAVADFLSWLTFLFPALDALPRGADGHPVREERVPDRHQGVWEQHQLLFKMISTRASVAFTEPSQRHTLLYRHVPSLCSMTPGSASGAGGFQVTAKPPTIPGIIVSVNRVQSLKSAICEPFISALVGVLLNIVLLFFQNMCMWRKV